MDAWRSWTLISLGNAIKALISIAIKRVPISGGPALNGGARLHRGAATHGRCVELVQSSLLHGASARRKSGGGSERKRKKGD